MITLPVLYSSICQGEYAKNRYFFRRLTLVPEGGSILVMKVLKCARVTLKGEETMNRTFALILVLVIIFAFAACGKEAEAPAFDLVEEHPVDAIVIVPAAEADPATDSDPDPDLDPTPKPNETMKWFLASPEDVQYGFYLQKNNQLYCLNSKSFTSPGSTRRNYYISEMIDGYSYNFVNAKVLVISFDKNGNVPVFENGDSVRYYSPSSVEDLELYNADPAGYTILAVNYPLGSGCNEFIMYQNNTESIGIRTDIFKISICDDNDNEIKDKLALEQGKEYTLFWYEGTQYVDIKMAADYPYYIIECAQPAYAIKGTLTKDGYATYDLSGVPKGLYHIRNGGLIRID